MSTEPPPIPPPAPPPFGDPTVVRAENRSAIGKGVLFGCGGCAVVLVGIAAVFAAIFFGVFAAVGNSDAVKAAIKHASDSSAIQQRLGTPLERSWMTTGNLETANGSSSADLRISVNGPKGSGKIHAVGYKRGNEPWTFTVLEVTIDATGQRINLLQPPSSNSSNSPFI